MGASHSGKHQLGPIAAHQQQQQNRSGEAQAAQHANANGNGNGHQNKAFGHSLRKNMGNMLLHPASPFKSSAGGSKKRQTIDDAIDSLVKTNTSSAKENIVSGRAEAATTRAAGDRELSDVYHVPSSSSSSSGVSPATRTRATAAAAAVATHNRQPSTMNNYVTMQQQQQLNRAPMFPTAASPMKARRTFRDENGNNGFVCVPTAAAATTTTPTRSLVYGATNNPMEMDSVHHHHQQLQQQHHHSRARSNAHNSSSSVLANTNNSIGVERPQPPSQQQQQQNNSLDMAHPNYHHQHQATPFQLSRAINTKTQSCVLTHHPHQTQTNGFTMNSNMDIASSSNGSGGAGSSSRGSSSGASSVAMRNSGRKPQKHRHNQHQQQQQQISSPAKTRTPMQQQQQQVARAANECCLPGSPYHCNPAASSYLVASPQQQQTQWRQQQHRYEPTGTSFHYADEQRYLQAADNDSPDYDTSLGSRHFYQQQQPEPLAMGHHYKPVQLQQQQQQQQYDPYETSHMFQPMSPNGGQLPIHYNRSYSFGSSLALDSKKIRSQNPLASLFVQSPQPATATTAASLKQQYANTIQVTRRNKSGYRQADSSPATGTSNGRSAPGSLKRVKSSLLSAQQASYEAMRTIDMYLIRQIARSCMMSKKQRIRRKVVNAFCAPCSSCQLSRSRRLVGGQ